MMLVVLGAVSVLDSVLAVLLMMLDDVLLGAVLILAFNSAISSDIVS